MVEVALSNQGRLYSWTIVRVAGPGFATPYALGYVDLPEGVRVLAQLDVPPAALCAGLGLQGTVGPIRTESDGNVVDGYRFEVAA
jgi:uncharacterized OB-fold protein